MPALSLDGSSKKRSGRFNLILMGVAFLATLVVTWLVIREPMEPLTAESLREARVRWREANIQDYEIRYDMHGSRYDVRVRNGVVVELRVGGKQPANADWGAYSVEGLFDVLDMEVENLTDSYGPFGAQAGTVIARVRFSQEHGHLERYLRSGGVGGSPVAIQLLDFVQHPQQDR